MCAMNGLVICEIDEGIKLGYAESIPKNAKKNENGSKKEIEIGHLKSENDKSKQIVPNRNELKRNWQKRKTKQKDGWNRLES